MFCMRRTLAFFTSVGRSWELAVFNGNTVLGEACKMTQGVLISRSIVLCVLHMNAK